ncbi:Twin-arginine translocation protein TatC [hydrothermal vent metagenome]|uniref:Twin-arginine translocation protein TatC n=1 Tax=hydrothermal vent metagenome TaxID=652676 RepID=A0A3B1AQM8_9ZZZZ
MAAEKRKQSEIPFVSHLIELRDRLLRVVLLVLMIFLVLFYFANDIYTYLAEPLTTHMSKDSTMIATDVISPFLTPMKLSLVLSIFLVMPYILYQIWSFIAPGLYKHEKELAFPLLVSSIILFYSGMAFAYYVVFPLIFGFITAIAPEGVEVMTDISKYLDFVLMLFFAFGAAFEVPVATVLLVAAGITTPENLIKKRAYVIVGAFVLGMFLTPPDVISQVMLAVPMWILFEFGVIASRMVVKRRIRREKEIAEEEENEDFQELSDAEMDAELDQAISDEADISEPKPDNPDK